MLENDVAGKKVVPGRSKHLEQLISPELSQLKEEYPEVFAACVVTSAQSKQVGACEPVEQESQEDSSAVLSGTVFAQWGNPTETNTVLIKEPILMSHRLTRIPRRT